MRARPSPFVAESGFLTMKTASLHLPGSQAHRPPQRKGAQLNRLRKEAAVHDDVRASHKARCLVRGKEDGGADEFVAFAETLHRSVAPDGLRARAMVFSISARSASVLGM